MPLSKTRKQIVTSAMKDAIFEAADSVIAEHGIAGMTMDRVATNAGLTAGSLYNYFRNKDDLVRFVLDRIVEPFFTAIEAICHSDLPASRKLKDILQLAVRRGNENQGLTRLLMDSNQYSQIRKTTHPRVVEIVAGLCRRGIEEGSFRSHNPNQASRLFAGALSELLELQAGAASNEDIAEYIRFVSDAMLAALSVSRAAEPRDAVRVLQS